MERQLHSLLDHVQDDLVISQQCCDQMQALTRRVWGLPLEKDVAAKTEAFRGQVGSKSEEHASNRDSPHCPVAPAPSSSRHQY